MTVATERGEFFFSVARALEAGVDLDKAAEIADAEICEVRLCDRCGTIMRIDFREPAMWYCPQCGEEEAF